MKTSDQNEAAVTEQEDSQWPELVYAPAPPPVSNEERQALWQQLLANQRRRALSYWEHYQKSPAQMHNERAEGWTEEDERRLVEQRMERILSTSYRDLQWSDFAELSHLADEGVTWGEWTEQSYDLWTSLKEHARTELESGHRAADPLESFNSTPMDRARFLVLRESFAKQWQPRGGVEMILIDQMAQAHTMWERWMKNASLRQSMQWTGDQKLVFERSVWAGPPQTEAEATKAAGDDADRWHRVFVRALRQLRDLRRYNVNITANQVNIAQQQVNVSGGTDDKSGESQ